MGRHVTSLTYPGRPLRPVLTALAYCCLLATSHLLSGSAAAQIADPRSPLPPHSPQWQNAIGHLQVPITRLQDGRRRHFTEHCSATSVTPGPFPLFLTAWHCLDGYDSLIEPIVLVTNHGLTVRLRVLDSGGSMAADWAVLQAVGPIDGLHWIPLGTGPLRTGARVSAAGFAPTPTESLDARGGQFAKRQLLFHAACEVTDAVTVPQISNCVAHRGASGGAILSRTESGSVRLSGVISAGDSNSVVLYHPTAALIERVQALR